MDAVALETERVRLGVAQVVDRHQFEIMVRAAQNGARNEASRYVRSR